MQQHINETIAYLAPQKLALTLLLIAALLATAFPYAWARLKAGDEWRGVTPHLSHDAMYYFTRANDVTRGHLYARNAYFFEHRDDESPTPTFNDLSVALPQLLGFSFNAGYYINIFLWAFSLMAIGYALLRKHALPSWLAVLGVLWTYFGLYGDMLRPGAMQTVYPLYLLFLLVFFRYTEDKRQWMPLAVVAGLTAYFYIFLFLLVGATLLSYFLHTLWTRDRTETLRTLKAGMLALAIALPHYAHTAYLSGMEFYIESLERISFVYSRWPGIEAYHYGRWVVVGLLLACLLRRLAPHMFSENAKRFSLITGAGLLLGMVANALIGVDFDIAFHVAKFSILWCLLMSIVFLLPVYHSITEARGKLLARVVLLALFAAFTLELFINIGRAVSFVSMPAEQIREVQTYSGVLGWLKDKEVGVVAAPEDLNSYIPLLLKHYVLYNRHGDQFRLSNDELWERYLLHHAFDRVSEDEFASTSYPHGRAPDGYARASALRYRSCVLLGREDCPPPQPPASFIALSAMRKKYSAYYPDLPSRAPSEYARYHVKYVVSRTESPHPLSGTAACPETYRDERFMVCTMANIANSTE